MVRISLFLLIFLEPFLNGFGQCVVSMNKAGQVITTCEVYSIKSHIQQVYDGSPFLTYPVWQAGKIQLDSKGQELTCELAYNLVANEVQVRLVGDSTDRVVTPELFTINGTEFVRQQNKLLGIDYRLYTTVLYNGQTKLLVSLTKRIDGYQNDSNGYTKESSMTGVYKTLSNYYIRKGDAKPELITLTKTSVVSALYEQAEKIAARLPNRNLTPAHVVDALAYYDSLMADDWINKPPFAATSDTVQRSSADYAISKAPLSKDPDFRNDLHHKIVYPSSAWTQGIYSRVYAGFEISPQGRIKNIVILSPDNGGAGFVESVRSGLENLMNINPAFSGKYALPITFTYTNSKENIGTHKPVNRLPENRLEGRTVLEEFPVSIVVSKPVISSREVWGYYK